MTAVEINRPAAFQRSTNEVLLSSEALASCCKLVYSELLPRFQVQGGLFLSCRAPKPASLHPKARNESKSSHLGVLIILITIPMALLNGFSCRNIIKANIFKGFSCVLLHPSHTQVSQQLPSCIYFNFFKFFLSH